MDGRGWGLETDASEQRGGVRSGDEESATSRAGGFGRSFRLDFGEVVELDVVHDDEAIEQGGEGGEARAIGLEQEGLRVQEGSCVALDAPLGTEDEVVAALARRECLDGIRDHAIEPTDAIFAGNAYPSVTFDRSQAGRGQQGAEPGIRGESRTGFKAV